MNPIAIYVAAAREAELARRALEPPRPVADRPITRRRRRRGRYPADYAVNAAGA